MPACYKARESGDESPKCQEPSQTRGSARSTPRPRTPLGELGKL